MRLREISFSWDSGGVLAAIRIDLAEGETLPEDGCAFMLAIDDAKELRAELDYAIQSTEEAQATDAQIEALKERMSSK
jgi:hypothetical protein